MLLPISLPIKFWIGLGIGLLLLSLGLGLHVAVGAAQKAQRELSEQRAALARVEAAVKENLRLSAVAARAEERVLTERTIRVERTKEIVNEIEKLPPSLACVGSDGFAAWQRLRKHEPSDPAPGDKTPAERVILPMRKEAGGALH